MARYRKLHAADIGDEIGMLKLSCSSQQDPTTPRRPCDRRLALTEPIHIVMTVMIHQGQIDTSVDAVSNPSDRRSYRVATWMGLISPQTLDPAGMRVRWW